MNLSIGDRSMLSVFPLPEIRRLVLTPGFHVPVHSVLGRVQGSSNKPLGKRRGPFQYPFPFLVPKKLAGNAGPEKFWVSERISFEGGVLFLRLGCLLFG